MFVVNMTFISSREVKNMYISFVPSALMKYTFFHFTRWNFNFISWSEKYVYFIRAFGAHEIYIFSLHSMELLSREVKNMYISFVPSSLMKYTFFHFTRWNKSHIQSNDLNILYILPSLSFPG